MRAITIWREHPSQWTSRWSVSFRMGQVSVLDESPCAPDLVGGTSDVQFPEVPVVLDDRPGAKPERTKPRRMLRASGGFRWGAHDSHVVTVPSVNTGTRPT